jgi:hypothetical protein
MPNFGVFPQTNILISQGTVTTNATTAALTLPPAQSYRMIVQVNTVTGTSPTLVVALATSFDGGTTYNSFMSTTSITATGSGQSIVFRPYLGVGDVATSGSCTLLGTTDLAAAVINNGPINPQFVKVRFVVSGTSPSYSAVTVGIIAVPQDATD